MIFVDRLPPVDASQYLLRNIELHKTDESLAEYEDICNETHDAVGTCESSLWVTGFIYLDDYQTCYQRHDPNQIQCEVDMRSGYFLLRSVGGL